MKKKDVIGHMTAPKESRAGFFKRLHLGSLLLCLLAAVLIWLVIVNIRDHAAADPFSLRAGPAVSEAAE